MTAAPGAPAGEVLGLIAGGGELPVEIARAARRRGLRVAAVAFHEQTDAGIGECAQAVVWLHPGEVAAAIEALLSAGARQAVLAGRVPKGLLYGEKTSLKLDGTAREGLGRLRDLRDASILGAVARHLESCGIRLLSQTELVPELLAGEGPLGACEPTPAQWADVVFGWPLAKAIAGLDIGQTVVVKQRAVLAVESIEGTDAAIRRGGAFGAGACVVKVARPGQDPRFDLPTIGPETATTLIQARASLLAFEAEQTVVVNRPGLVRLADAHGIALVGVAAGRMPRVAP